jgi:uncharacterized protein (DUF488 family)
MSREFPHPPRAAPGWGGAHVFSVGHSTRPIEELIEMLRSFGVETLADIRTIPRSRHNPQFDGKALAASMRDAGIRYVHLRRLGGLRHARADSPNAAWRNASFRGFADYMLTEEFKEGLEELRTLAERGPVAILCAEAVPWRCHRSLVSDALFARGVLVEHIAAPGRSSSHRLTSFAQVEGRKVLYPAEEQAASP